MDYRIEMMVKPQWHDARGAAVLDKIRNFFKKEVKEDAPAADSEAVENKDE